MRPKILFRNTDDTRDEFEAARSVWGEDLIEFRSDVEEDDLVIGRYSVLPYYGELDREVRSSGGRLVHDHKAHKLIAEMKWARPLSDLTPSTWFDVGWANAPETEHGWIVKGRTNSRKFKWKTHMRAETRDDLKRVMANLRDDSLIGDQGLVVREYVPLEKLGEGINGVPISNEWRCFFLGETLIDSGFYWSILEEAEDMGELPPEAEKLARNAAERWAGGDRPFFVLDVAKTCGGDWIIVEVNDGQMSGLSTIEPRRFYQNLRQSVEASDLL